MTNDEIRRYRLNELIAAHQTVAALARLLGVSSSQLSQWRNASPDSKTGKPRTMSDGAARRLEDACHKPRGWMDTPPEHGLHQETNARTNKGFQAAEPDQSTYRRKIELEALARSISQRANDVAAMWMRLDPARQTDIENMLRTMTESIDCTMTMLEERDQIEHAQALKR